MHFLIFGSTGPSGLLTLREALERNHTAIVYVRSPDKLPYTVRQNSAVTIIQGELSDESKMATCFLPENNVLPIDGVISALGSVRGQPRGNPITAGYAILLRLMHRFHVANRLVLLSTVSVSSPRDHWSTIRETLVAGIKLIGYTAWTDVVATGELMQSEASAGIIVTMARVPTLTDGEGGTLKVGYVADGTVGWQLARKDFATFMVDEGEQSRWGGEIPLLSS